MQNGLFWLFQLWLHQSIKIGTKTSQIIDPDSNVPRNFVQTLFCYTWPRLRGRSVVLLPHVTDLTNQVEKT